ncbi:MAG: zinc ribbon domain-containing protein [Chitinispirillia bacterium]|jgi:putative FmdB family regulatory protein
MPIYEFLCPSCNTIFKFFSRSINTEKIPLCPKCSGNCLKRQISLFSSPGKAKEDSNDLDNLPVDETKMAHAMQKLMGEAEKMNDEDPRKAVQLMQKFSSITGLKYNDSIQEALSRLESGEDPENIEAQMGEAFEGEDPFILPAKNNQGKKPVQPSYDDTLYEM